MTNRYPEFPRLRSPLLCLATAVALAGCATTPEPLENDPALMQEALNGTGSQRPPLSEPQPLAPQANPSASAGPRQQIMRGSQRFVRNPAPASSTKAGAAEVGDIVFNFTNQPIEAVINSVMGDLLHENYSIAQGVKGDVSFSTSKPVNKQQALSILETLLSWTDNAMIRQGDRYVILPANQAVAGKLVPEMPVARPSSGMSARLFPLHYISATEMQKLLKPFARDNAFLLVDPGRNVLSLAGTPDELANYQDTIDTFDVDWLKGMSVGVYGLQRASVAELMPELTKMFGPDSGLPTAGMVRFMPIERTNSIVAISAQPQYLSEVGDWIRTIDEGGGNEPQMYVYDVRNMKAADLAKYLRQIYGNGQIKDDSAARVAPGLRTRSLSSLNGSNGNSVGMGFNGTGQGMGSASAMGLNGGNANLQGGLQQSDADTDAEGGDEAADSTDSTYGETAGTPSGASQRLDDSTRITAQKSSNQLLIRTRPAQWAEIESAIKRLDNAPMQVQIETRILEVNLSGELDLGVQWYLGRLAGNSGSNTVANAAGSQGALGGGGAGLGATDSLFYSFVSNNLQVALHALETNGRTQVLSAPSLVVMNNQQAQIQVGDNIPISQTTVNTNVSNTTLSSVEYVQTGVILDVVPRINPGGLVYLDIQQQVSDADNSAASDNNGNPRISTRSVSTQVAVQSGQTVLLGGLIKQDNSDTASSVPYLGRIPGLRWLFGSTSKSKKRTELLVLITPRVVTSNSQARQVTDDYRQQLQLIKPRQ
ncbi:type II secretion system secretin GspD [Pseudomonas sp. DTU_2021_1001937_2_SI_NGA_ILE_001]|uniref:type II secretion system secretin GspD n=1 Tax=Pseudomonas sp. DTU_2021_1001937_2_SI_NGA_ILE_001 TaxID=3077589 RepID=UPI0028FC2A52|nr:type II secretion system secretin GspD [Pseudomonas sp. DTU_2021_1001937_2_SI_NGA_ILE_001]WNW13325.1 type II secretion system secretin GspD [Pseudomonas sp. DTU_2021_1001937_2_SI_NGA_ILE_001]